MKHHWEEEDTTDRGLTWKLVLETVGLMLLATIATFFAISY